MSMLETFDHRFIEFAKNNYAWLARIALCIIYFYFGFLKVIGASPADDLALGFVAKMGMADFAQPLYIALAGVECVIGILILIPKFTRFAIFLMLGHMVIVCAPLILYAEAVWKAPLVPNLEGQYIIKNIALVVLALGLVAHTPPLAKKPTKRR